MYKFFISFLLLIFFLVPIAVQAAPVPDSTWTPFSGQGLVPCNNSAENLCDFDTLMLLIQNIISFLLWFSVPVATILFAIAGFMYMTAGDNEGQVKKAHQIFIDVVIGVIIMLSAFLLIYVIADRLLSDEYRRPLPLQPR